MTEAQGTTKTDAKKPWYKKLWIWGIVVAVLVVAGIGNLATGDEREAAQVDPTPTPIASESPEPAEPTEAAEEPAPEPEPAVDEEARSAAFEQAIRDAFGGQEYSEVFASDPTLWYGWISEVRTEGSNGYVTLQVGSGSPDRDDLGERAADALPRLLPADATADIDWIIVEDASGVVIAQSRTQ